MTKEGNFAAAAGSPTPDSRKTKLVTPSTTFERPSKLAATAKDSLPLP